MRQALHIFKKDFHGLRYEVSLMWAVTVAFAALDIRRRRGPIDSWEAEMLMVLIAAVLIGRLILAEAIPGDRQFWITRPYRWKSLLGAKLLFIAAFVNLPIFLAQLFIVALDGFPLVPSLPGLFWSQFLLFAFILLPIAAVGAVSRNLASFIFYAVVLLAIGAVIQVARLEGVGWVVDSVALVSLLAIAGPVLYLQYKRRRTDISRWFALGGIALAGIGILAMPWPMALAVQSRLSKQPSLAASVHVALGPSPAQIGWPAEKRPDGALYIPIVVQGIPPGTEVRTDALAISLQEPGGRTTTVNPFACADVTQHSESAGVVLRPVCRADPEFVKSNRDKLVTLRASVYLTLFGNAKSTTLPLTDEPTYTSDGLECYTDNVRAEWDVYCRSAFRWPGRLIYAKLGHTAANSFQQAVSYSPFPADLNINPIETRWASAYAAGPAPNVRDVTIIVEEPLAHMRRDLEARGVRLSDFVIPSNVRGVPPQKTTIQ
jgi:hypothetical protein